MLGKILFEAKAEERGRPRWDVVVVDAPSTGHAVQLLRVPAALLDTVPAGPLRGDAEWMQALLHDPARTALAIVTLPEEMPVNEAIDLDAQVRSVLGIPRAALFVNAMPEARFTRAEEARLEGLVAAPPPLRPAAAAGRLQALRAEQAQRYLARARRARPPHHRAPAPAGRRVGTRGGRADRRGDRDDGAPGGAVTAVREAAEGRRIVVCVGSGGVGKTTVAAAIARSCARRRPRARVHHRSGAPARERARPLVARQRRVARPRAQVRRRGAPRRGELHAMMLDVKRTWDDLVTRHAPDPRAASAS